MGHMQKAGLMGEEIFRLCLVIFRDSECNIGFISFFFAFATLILSSWLSSWKCLRVNNSKMGFVFSVWFVFISHR